MTDTDASKQVLLAQTLVDLADTLVAEFDVVELLIRLADRCVETLQVDAAGIMLAAPDRGLKVIASSSEAMRLLEVFEVQSDEGPCLDCYRTGEPVVNQNLAGIDDRWPLFSPKALDAGFHSAHALPMRLRGSVIGALISSTSPKANCLLQILRLRRPLLMSPPSAFSSTARRLKANS